MKHDKNVTAFTELEEWTWRKIEGSEHTWYVPLIPNAGDWIHRTDPDEQGHGGARISFELEDGTTDRVRGPWHEDPRALREDTGLNLRNLSMTRVNVRIGQGKLIYEENEPVMGERGRGLRIGEQLANLHGEPVTVETITTNAGRKWRVVEPNGQDDVHAPG